MQIIRKTLSIACLPLLICTGVAADAGEIINVDQVGANVQAVASGSLDLHNAFFTGTSINTSSFVFPSGVSLILAPIGIPTTADNYEIAAAGPTTIFGAAGFGVGGLTAATTG
ncbi:MAG TPA: hypothetical protein VNX28_16725, partial [Gemmataceae bacterium]|nr:hypothetical protein [Gemmataceae bacterium]